MKRTVFALLLLFLLPLCTAAADGTVAVPDGTWTFAQKDSVTLQLDVYYAAAGSTTHVDGVRKPTVLFVFGGGFVMGARDEEHHRRYYAQLTAVGYNVVAIDYRLGLRGVHKMGVAQAGKLQRAIHMGEEDLLSATAWLLEHEQETGIDAHNIVLCGSSAGAIICLQTVWEMSNRTRRTRVLPDDYAYRGVMSFSGAVFSSAGRLRFRQPPCPTLLFHGTADQIVPYDQIKVLSVGFFGSNRVAERYARYGYPYRFYRHLNHGHEIAGLMGKSLDEQFDFLENVVCRGVADVRDEVIDSTWLHYTTGTAADLYR